MVVEASGSDSDDVYDEVDRFHMDQDANLLRPSKRRHERTKEVLSVDVDDEELSDADWVDFSANPGAIFQDGAIDSSNDEEDDVGITSNQWGKNKKDFYGTSYVDKDFGGIHDSDEAEVLELEEEDARNRQRKMESANALVDLDDFDVELESDDGEAAKTKFLTVDEALEYKRGQEEARRLQAERKRHEAKSVTRQKKNPEKNGRDEEAAEPDEKSPPLAADHKRHITYEMMKNKGIMADKGKKKTSHSRVKKRKQFDKALIRRRSQVPDVRRELTKYDGEKRGIRMSTIRSVKLS